MEYTIRVYVNPEDNTTDAEAEFAFRNQLNYGWQLVKIEKCKENTIDYTNGKDVGYILTVRSNSEKLPELPPYSSDAYSKPTDS